MCAPTFCFSTTYGQIETLRYFVKKSLCLAEQSRGADPLLDARKHDNSLRSRFSMLCWLRNIQKRKEKALAHILDLLWMFVFLVTWWLYKSTSWLSSLKTTGFGANNTLLLRLSYERKPVLWLLFGLLYYHFSPVLLLLTLRELAYFSECYVDLRQRASQHRFTPCVCSHVRVLFLIAGMSSNFRLANKPRPETSWKTEFGLETVRLSSMW